LATIRWSPERKPSSDIVAAQSPDLLRRAHDLLAAPRLFGHEIGFNLPAFLIALGITAILVIGIRESARFNATIVVVKVSVVLFVIALGAMYVHPGNWGHGWSTFAPMGFSGVGAGAAYIFFAYIGFDAVSTTAQEARNPQRDLPIGIIASLLICTVLYIAVAGVLTGMVPWQNVNIEAPIARAFLDRGLNVAADVITLGALAGLTSVMLVMLLGQTRVLYAMANDGLLPKKFFADIHPRFRTPWKNTIREDGQHRHAAGVRDRVHRHHVPAPHRSAPTASLPHAVGAGGADSGHPVQRVHDVQVGLGELGPAVRLAGDRPGGVLHLRALS
jgi:APA family basic amino acid/polyamine antiporter